MLNATFVAFLIGVSNIKCHIVQNINIYSLNGGDKFEKRTIIRKPQ